MVYKNERKKILQKLQGYTTTTTLKSNMWINEYLTVLVHFLMVEIDLKIFIYYVNDLDFGENITHSPGMVKK